jgi:hypothetical protein
MRNIRKILLCTLLLVICGISLTACGMFKNSGNSDKIDNDYVQKEIIGFDFTYTGARVNGTPNIFLFTLTTKGIFTDFKLQINLKVEDSVVCQKNVFWQGQVSAGEYMVKIYESESIVTFSQVTKYTLVIQGGTVLVNKNAMYLLNGDRFISSGLGSLYKKN